MAERSLRQRANDLQRSVAKQNAMLDDARRGFAQAKFDMEVLHRTVVLLVSALEVIAEEKHWTDSEEWCGPDDGPQKIAADALASLKGVRPAVAQEWKQRAKDATSKIIVAGGMP